MYEGGEGEYADHEGGGHEHDYEGSGEEVDFEDALADMDSEDLNAVIEGAQEDYVLSEVAVEESNEAAGAEAEGSGEKVENGALSVEGGESEVALEGEHSGAVDVAEDGAEASTTVIEEQVTIKSAVEDPTSEPLAEDAASLAVPESATGDLFAPPIVEISYDTPLGTGDEPSAVPLEQLDAVVDAASKLGPSPLSVSNGVAGAEAVKDLGELFLFGSLFAQITNLLLADEPEEPSNDVVIDYEDAEEVTATTTLPPPSAKDSPMSPKRGREDSEEEVPAIDDESAAGTFPVSSPCGYQFANSRSPPSR